MAFLASFAFAIALSLVLTRAVRDWAKTHGRAAAPTSKRHLHTTPIPRLGGVAIFVSFSVTVGLAAAFLRPTATASSMLHSATILIPAALMFLVGLWDDRRELPATVKLCAQCFAGALLYLLDFRVVHLSGFLGGTALPGWASFLATVGWVALVTNAINLIDGMDGLAAGSGLVSTMVLFVACVRHDQVALSLIAIALAGAILGFLRFNFHPASIFMGDCGSLTIGLILAAVALSSSQKSPTAVALAAPILALGLPILESGWTIVRRLLRGRPIFQADNEHFHHKLLQLGLPQRDAVLVLYSVSAGSAAASLLLVFRGGEKLPAVLTFITLVVVIGLKRLQYPEIAELRRLIRRVARQKALVANDIAVLHATQRLQRCEDLDELCEALKDALEPLGFCGVRFTLANSAGLHHPIASLRLGRGGELRYDWAEVGSGLSEFRFAMETGNGVRLGMFSVSRDGASKPLTLDSALLTSELPKAVSAAVHRIVNRPELVQEQDDYAPAAMAMAMSND